MVSKLLILFNLILLIAVGGLIYFYPHSPKTRVWEGQTWTAIQYGNKYLLSVKNHSELAAAIISFAKAQKIKAGTVYGIGAVNTATLRFFDPATKKYVDKNFDGQMEISNLTGNIATQEGSELIHLHITLGQKDYHALAGHLLSANISGAGEFVIETLPDVTAEKTFDDKIGLNLYNFKK